MPEFQDRTVGICRKCGGPIALAALALACNDATKLGFFDSTNSAQWHSVDATVDSGASDAAGEPDGARPMPIAAGGAAAVGTEFPEKGSAPSVFPASGGAPQPHLDGSAQADVVMDAPSTRPDEASDAAPPAADAGCAALSVWHPDDDGDGYGGSSTWVVACAPPSRDGWVTVGGDCNDSDRRVHPGQTSYFTSGYAIAEGVDSFDYDCSGVETGDPDSGVAAPSCGALLPISCSGSGYASTPRTGLGVNPLCGSHVTLTCALSAVLCISQATSASSAYRCH